MLKEIIDDNEKILWEGKPDFIIYLIGNPFIYIIAIIWLLFYYMIFRDMDFMVFEFGFFKSVGSIFLIFHLFPVWLAIFGPIYRAFNYKTIEYAITDKRSYISSGLFGRDISIVEHRFVENLTVNVNIFENMRGLGTLKLTPDIVTSVAGKSKTVRGYAFYSIKKPYEVYKLLKNISLDVTTDQQFPNAYRPKENPGYNTKLKK